MVEDDAEVGDLTREMLQALGYALLHASRPAEALAWAEGCPGAIHLLLTDVVMPEISGRDLADRVSRHRPGIRVLFMSGYTDNILAPHGVLDAGTALLQKPFTPVALARKVREVLDASPARAGAPAS
jgi:CheY-like chemotaxis protein